MEVQQTRPFQVGGSLWVPNDTNRYLRRSRRHRDKTWAEIGVVGTLDPAVSSRWPILRIVTDLHLPLSEVEKWDLDDIRHVNAVLNMRQDYEGAADAFQAEQLKKQKPGGRK